MSLSFGSDSHLSEGSDGLELCHRTIQVMLFQIIPTGISKLFPTLERAFPHKRFDLHVLRDYVAQLLLICEYLPMCEFDILDLITCRCLEIDVEIVIEDGGDVKIISEFESDDADTHFTLDEDDERRHSLRPISDQCKIPDAVAIMADKLDTILGLLLRYICNVLDCHSPAAKERLFHNVLSIFEDRVLATHRSKYVQFIVFYIASRDTLFEVAFVERLKRLFFDNHGSVVKRQSAVMYLASFLSRAKFISKDTICKMLSTMIGWASSYVVRTDEGDARVKVGGANWVQNCNLFDSSSKFLNSYSCH